MKKFWLIITSFVCFLALFSVAQAAELPNKYPRIANIYYDSDISEKEAEALAKWDLLVIGLEVGNNNPEVFNILRKKNPDIIILAYIASEELPDYYAEITDKNDPHYQLYQGILEDWYLKNSAGEYLSNWPGTKMMNVSSPWGDYLADFMSDAVSSPKWDGVFYDNVWNDISWLNSDIDIDNDGDADAAATIDQAWKAGMANLMSKTRSGTKKDIIVIGNGGGSYYTYINGRLVEDFSNLGNTSWSERMQNYFGVMDDGKAPPVVVLNGMGNQDDYKKFRFTVASTLLDDGFVSYDYSISNHGQLWWYDEYDVALGEPTNKAFNILDQSNPYAVKSGVWRRDFEEGMVIVNSTNKKKKVSLGGPYEKIKGFQDTKTNSGEVINTLTLGPKDGIILLKRLSEVDGVTFNNGAFAKVFDYQGRERRVPFYSYDASYAGGAQVVYYDIDNNGKQERVVADDSTVYIYNYKNQLIKSFCPYGCSYNMGINLAVGYLNRDKKAEIVTGTKNGGGPHVIVFNYRGRQVRPGFFAYNKNYRGGVNIALGDVNSDGRIEIVVGAGVGGGPHVRAFDQYGRLVDPGFFAFSKKMRGGVNVAVGDVNNDGKAEIVAGAGSDYAPYVKIFSGRGKLLKKAFLAYPKTYRGGVKVQILDIDGNGTKEILTMTQ